MLTRLVDTPLSLLTLGAQAHSVLNANMIPEIAAVMKRQKWTCHVCGVRLPGMMEVDHLKGHKVSGKDALAPICQVCHDRKHLLWAASRKRITLIHAPDFSHEEISQLTWSLVTHSDRPGFDIDRRNLMRDLKARQEDAFDALGHDNLEAIFEAILAISDVKGVSAARALLEEMDTHLRIAPMILCDEKSEIKVWSVGGFRSPDEDWRAAVLAEQVADYDTLKRAGEALKARI